MKGLFFVTNSHSLVHFKDTTEQDESRFGYEKTRSRNSIFYAGNVYTGLFGEKYSEQRYLEEMQPNKQIANGSQPSPGG